MSKEHDQVFFICSNCGPFIPCYEECFCKTSNQPIMFNLISHRGGQAIIVDEIKINEKNDEIIQHIIFCGLCRNTVKMESCEPFSPNILKSFDA